MCDVSSDAVSRWLVTWSNNNEVYRAVCEGRVRRDRDRVGLIAALIAVGIIVAATTLGSSLSGLFNKISGKMNVTVP